MVDAKKDSHFSSQDLEAMADAILYRSGYDKDGSPLKQKPRDYEIVVSFKPRKGKPKEVPAVG